ncbi:MarR family winged helix-turn-helix transcriptional regulator [Sphingobium sp. SCG-1]|uniref:MarR family winged helix-turn-helix transcriptional regulator n=1 Tax=Sphingobium sp. SCG-1 TaxID=2072936 RepID=UPI0011AB625A|nr:MarR family winged helix-turn-helix transcriptional regulator [Sphingobium sp. SCG-1]
MHQSSVCACTALRKASRAITRVYDDALSEQGMTTTQFAILRNLARGEIVLSRLAERLVMDRTSLYRTITPVIREGWAEIIPDGKRSKIAHLTDAGRAALERATPAWEATQSRFVDELGVAEWQSLQATLNTLVQLSVKAES